MRKIIFLLFACVLSKVSFSKQWVIFYADWGQVDHPFQKDSSKAGHAFVSFVKEDPIKKQTLIDSWGFYPKSPNEAGWISYVEGEIKNDIYRQREIGFMTEVTELELQACIKTKDIWVNSKYSVTMRNCVDFLRDIVNTLNENRITGKSRFKQPIGLYIFPSEYIQMLKVLNHSLEYKLPIKVSPIQKSEDGLSDGAKLLFNEAITTYYTALKLTPIEKESIYKQLNFQLSNDKKKIHDMEDTDLQFALTCRVIIIDLNNDGKLEVIVSRINSYWTGQVGDESVFTKNNFGEYIEVLSIHGFIQILSTSSSGYPDLMVGGPGYIAPWYKWNGIKYQFYKEVQFGKNQIPDRISFEDYYKKQKRK